MRFYEALDLEPKLSLDLDDLKRRFYERSRQWHPDRFTRAPAQDRQRALDMTAVLNDAFRTLKDPVSRAGYFLSESGMEVSKEAPPELLEEVFELNMALEELRSGDDSVRSGLESAQTRFEGMLAGIDASLADLFAAHDAAASPATLREVRGALNRRRYVGNLLKEVGKELNVHLPN